MKPIRCRSRCPGSDIYVMVEQITHFYRNHSGDGSIILLANGKEVWVGDEPWDLAKAIAEAQAKDQS